MPIVDEGDYSMETIQAAYYAITSGKTKGKIVISIG